MTTKKSTMVKSGGNTTMSTTRSYLLFHRSYTYTSGIKALIAFLIALFLFIITHILKFPGSVGYLSDILNGQKTFDLSPSFTSSETYIRLQAFGEVRRTLYMRTMLTVDFIFPVSMFLFLHFFSNHALANVKLPPGLAKLSATLPVLYLFLDFIENVGIFILISNYPHEIQFIGSNIGFLTVGKRIFMMAAIFLPSMLLVRNKIWRRFYQGYQPKSQRFHLRK